MPHDLYARLVCSADVTLDPFPFGGGVTMTDSLLCRRQPDIRLTYPEDEAKSRTFVVPFVTSSALQTVHAIGSGIGRFIDRVDTPGIDKQFPTLSVAVDASLGSQGLTGETTSSQDDQIEAYVLAAVTLADRADPMAVEGARMIQIKEHLQADDAVLEDWKQFFSFLSLTVWFTSVKFCSNRLTVLPLRNSNQW
jgi:hypothetical protein